MYRDEQDPMSFIKPTGDYLALCGDIGAPGKEPQYKRFLHLIKTYSPHFKHIFVVAGNHEYYVPGQEKEKATVAEVDKILDEICSSVPNATYLQQKSVLVEGVRVIGATLWSKVFDDKRVAVMNVLSDYKHCYTEDESEVNKTRLVTVLDTLRWHEEHLAYILKEVELAKTKGENCVILTHHAPLIEGTCHPKHDKSAINSAFTTDLKKIIKHKEFNHVKLWAFGHTHYNSTRVVGKTTVMANQKCYSFETKVGIAYKKDHVLEIN